MNQIEWCQVRLDITQEIQVTRRSKLPGDLALGNLPGDPVLGNLPGDPVLGNLPRDPVLGNLPGDPALENLPGDPALGNLIVLKPSTHRHNCFAEN